MSASTRKSKKSQTRLSVEKKGRGLGYFGDEDDKIKEQKNREEFESKLRVNQEVKTTDEEGKVRFSKLPIGKYLIEVEGNGEFQP